MLTTNKPQTILEPQSLPMVRQADHIAGPTQGHWTYADYLKIPDDGNRYEIIEGVLYMAPSPNFAHQKTSGLLYIQLATHIYDNGLGEIIAAPFDVELWEDEVVQPDILVILNEHKNRIEKNKILGAPDLVVEIASPGTAGYDRRKKQDAYAKAAVPEYWIVEPNSKSVEVLTLVEGEQINTYQSQGVFVGKATLPSKIVPNFIVEVEKFFA